MKKLALIGVSLTALCLASCGGSSTVPSNLVLSGNLQSVPSTPTYSAGSEELAAYNKINDFRASMQLGLWYQNPSMDAAANNHMAYSVQNAATINNAFQNDIEVAGKPGYTGSTPSQRAVNLKPCYCYLQNTITALNVPTATVGELYSTGTGANITDAMVNTIYHRSGLMNQSTVDMGLARDSSGTIDPQAFPPTHWWINHGNLLSTQYVSSDYLQHYPTTDSVAVPLSMTPENPSVYSSIANFNFATSTSSPLSLTASPQVKLLIKSWTVTPDGSTTPLPGKIWTMDNDPNLLINSTSAAITSATPPPAATPTLSAFEAYWVGNAPFLPNTKYNVTVTGTTFLTSYSLTNTVTQTWSFTTGSQ